MNAIEPAEAGGRMDAQRSQFLTSMIEILDRLNQSCVSRGEPLLASVLAIAKGEAEDALRHAEELNALHELREKMSSQNTWRAADQARLRGEADEDEAAAYAEDDYATEQAPEYDDESYEEYETERADEIAA